MTLRNLTEIEKAELLLALKNTEFGEKLRSYFTYVETLEPKKKNPTIQERIKSLSNDRLDQLIKTYTKDVKQLCTNPPGTIPSGSQFYILGLLKEEKEKRQELKKKITNQAEQGYFRILELLSFLVDPPNDGKDYSVDLVTEKILEEFQLKSIEGREENGNPNQV